MDSLEVEQNRGITMKSNNKKYLINLIDTPGHVDFSSEISTVVQLCDGAIILVDVVEGLRSQTLATLRQAWLEHLRIILVFNKIDRLFVEHKWSSHQAYGRIHGVLKHINDVVAKQFTSLLLEKSAEQEVMEKANNDDGDDNWTKNESQIYFSPDYNNVLFASTLDEFIISQIYMQKKLSVKREILMKTLWGDYYFDKKTKRVCKGAQSKGQKPMFVQFIFENLWSVYEAIIIRRDNGKLEKIAASIGAKLTPRDIQHTDPYVPLHLIFNQWLPIASAVFDMVVVQLPNPKALNIEKIEQLMCNKGRRFDTLLSETQQLKQAFINCSSDDQEPVIIYVSKLFYVNKNALSQNRHKSLTAEDIAQERELIKEKEAEETTTNEELTNETKKRSIDDRKRSIGQLDSLGLKSATLSTNIFCPSFSGLQFEASPIVRVAIKSKDSSQMEQLRHGVHLLNQADPFVECTLKDTSEYILSTAGEEHLQRCIDDLTKIYARIEINVSTPTIPFHETIIAPPKVDFLNESLANQQQQFESNKTIEERLSCLLVELSTPNGQCTFQIRAVELSDDIAVSLKIHSKLLAVIEEAQGRDDRKVIVQLNDQTLDQIRQLRERLNAKIYCCKWKYMEFKYS
ncbi:unnamed protein product [Rotaria sp. Silwood2]|nr:unnamed protein product [Rotaria sp. Silwood2]